MPESCREEGSMVHCVPWNVHTGVFWFVVLWLQFKEIYHKVTDIRRTKSPNLNVSRLVLKLSSPNPMKPGVKSRTKM